MNKAKFIRSQFLYNRKQILFLTGMSDEQYSNFQIDTAKAWVECYWQNVIDVNALLNTTVFWKWWMYEWNCADDRWVLSRVYRASKKKRLTRYRELHQYVFDEQTDHQQLMIVDFRNMRPEFDKAIKNPRLL